MDTRKAFAAIAVTAALLLSACSGGSDEPDTEAAPTEEVEAEEVETEEEAETEEEEAEVGEGSSLDADEVEQAMLTTLGVDSFQELDADHWGYYIADVETPSDSTIRLTMQTDSEDPIIDGSSETIFSLIGGQFEDVTTLELVDGAGNHIEQTHRRNVPLLN